MRKGYLHIVGFRKTEKAGLNKYISMFEQQMVLFTKTLNDKVLYTHTHKITGKV